MIHGTIQTHKIDEEMGGREREGGHGIVGRLVMLPLPHPQQLHLGPHTMGCP